jgi:hypothetical protein
MQVFSNSESHEIGFAVILKYPARSRELKGARLHEKIEQDQQGAKKGENQATGHRASRNAAKRAGEAGRHSFEA